MSRIEGSDQKKTEDYMSCPRVDPGWSDLHCAVFEDDVEEIEKQIEEGVSINIRNAFGATPLHIACLRSDSECIDAVLQHNPSMNVQEKTFNMTPLIMFVSTMRHESRYLKMMLLMGADPNISQLDGNTPLHIVAKAKCGMIPIALQYASLLLLFDADVNSRNNEGMTPLHLAIERRFSGLIPILLKGGACMNIENNSGVSPLRLAFDVAEGNLRPLGELGKHIIIETCCKKFDNPGIVEKLCEKSRKLKDFKEECDSELMNLKCQVKGQTLVTYYDLLVLPYSSTAKYLRNRDIFIPAKQRITPTIFGHVFSRIVRKAKERTDAIDIGLKFGRKVFPINIPELCLDKIFSYLSNDDLLQLKKVTPL